METPVTSRKKSRASVALVADLVVFGLLYAGYSWARYHHLPPHGDWLALVAVWYAVTLVRGGYRRIVGELERQNALLVKVLTRLEEQGRRERAA